MNVTDTMVDHFHQQGFFFMPCPFDAKIMKRFRELVNETEEQFQNTDWSENKSALTCRFFMLSEITLELAEDVRLVSLAERLLGVDQVHVGTCGVGDGASPMFPGRDGDKGLYWHADGSPDIKQVSIRIAIDRHGIDEGGLRILPGSHLLPLDRVKEELVQLELASGEHDAIPTRLHCTHPNETPIMMDPRWTLVWSPSCWHGTTPNLNGKQRRTICWNYFPPGGRATCKQSVQYALGDAWQDWSDARKGFWGMH